MTESDRAEILLRLYEEQRESTRHQDQLRASIVATLLTLDSAIAGVLAYLVSTSPHAEELSLGLYVVGLLFVFLGMAGLFLVEKHHERARLYAERADQLRRRIDSLVPGLEILTAFEQAEREHSRVLGKNARWLQRASLSGLWTAIHLFVIEGGLWSVWFGLHMRPVSGAGQWAYAAGVVVASLVGYALWQRHRIAPKARAKLIRRETDQQDVEAGV